MYLGKQTTTTAAHNVEVGISGPSTPPIVGSSSTIIHDPQEDSVSRPKRQVRFNRWKVVTQFYESYEWRETWPRSSIDGHNNRAETSQLLRDLGESEDEEYLWAETGCNTYDNKRGGMALAGGLGERSAGEDSGEEEQEWTLDPFIRERAEPSASPSVESLPSFDVVAVDENADRIVDALWPRYPEEFTDVTVEPTIGAERRDIRVGNVRLGRGRMVQSLSTMNEHLPRVAMVEHAADVALGASVILTAMDSNLLISFIRA